MAEPPPRFAGAVLTGGASRRMGRDKATLPIDGVAMAVRVAGALRAAGATRVAAVGLAVPGEVHVADDQPGEGPVAGVLTALRWTGDEPLVVAPCDLVMPDAGAFAVLAAALLAAPGLAVTAGPGDPLPVALRPASIDLVAAAFAGGERSLRAVIAALGPRTVAVPRVAIADADTPEELPPGAG